MACCRKLANASLNHIFNALSIGIQYIRSHFNELILARSGYLLTKKNESQRCKIYREKHLSASGRSYLALSENLWIIRF